MKALKLVAKGKVEVLEVPEPALRPDYILIRTIAVALNPTDWKHIDGKDHDVIPTVGCDCAGVVEEIGPEVRREFKRGDRVWAFVHGCNKVQPEDGAFAEYVVAKGDIAVKIPDSMSFEEASTLGVGVITVGQGLYKTLKLPWPTEPSAVRKPILIYGGSTATGMLAIQFAKLSGLEVLTTCSPHNFEFVKSLGADAVFDYKSPTCAADIRSHTSDGLCHAWDTIGDATTRTICANALSTDPETHELFYAAILPVPDFPRWDVETFSTIAYTVQGERFEIGKKTWGANPEELAFGERWTRTAATILEGGLVKPHRVEVQDGGLQEIPQGLNELREWKVSGRKLVYHISPAGSTRNLEIVVED